MLADNFIVGDLVEKSKYLNNVVAAANRCKKALWCYVVAVFRERLVLIALLPERQPFYIPCIRCMCGLD